MLTLKNAQTLVQNVTQDAENTAFDSSNYCSVTTEDGIILHLQFNPDLGVLDVVGPIGELSEENSEEALSVFKELMNQNLLWMGTHGATISFVPEANVFVLQRRYDGNEDSPEDFENFVLSFVDEIRLWSDKYNGLLEQEDEGVGQFSIKI